MAQRASLLGSWGNGSKATVAGGHAGQSRTGASRPGNGFVGESRHGTKRKLSTTEPRLRRDGRGSELRAADSLTRLTKPLILRDMIVAIKDKFCGISEAAGILGCTTGRVRQLLLAGELIGEKVDDAANAPWFIERKSVEKFASVTPATGRPRGSSAS